MYNAPLLFCVSKKNFRYFFLLVFFKKTFSGIFFYLNSKFLNILRACLLQIQMI